MGRTEMTTDVREPNYVDAVASVEPIISGWPRPSDYSASAVHALYRMASKGDVIFVKLGGRTLVDFATLKAAVRRLPRAVINIAA